MAISAEQIADWNRRTEARSFWMRANGYEEPRGRAPESWWGFSDRFWHRVLGVKTWRYKDWERCHNGCPQLPGDHWDAFGRGKRISALVTQPYYGPALDEYEAAWRAAEKAAAAIVAASGYALSTAKPPLATAAYSSSSSSMSFSLTFTQLFTRTPSLTLVPCLR